MLDSIYASVNKAIAAAWATIAPGVPVVYGHPVHPATLPAECLRLYWLNYGSETEQGRQIYSMLQLDIRTPAKAGLPQLALALRRATALSRAMRLGINASAGRLSITNAAGKGVAFARVTPLETGWVNGSGDSPDPGLTILSRTVQVLSIPLIR